MLEPAQTLIIFQKQPKPKEFSAGQIIFAEGQPTDFMYGILAGEIEILVNNKVVETLIRGEVFGTGALIDTGSRNYTAIAKTECKLAFLDKQRFLFAVQETPMFALEVMKTYSQRLNRLEHQL